MKDSPELKVAIVCDWLTGLGGGAERVVFELHKLYPKAPIYTSQYDSSADDVFKNAEVHTTWLQKLPKGLKKFLPLLRAWSFSRLDLSDYDLVISASGAEAKFVRTGPKTTHVCYCHSPTHYYWIRYDDYLKHPGFPKGFNWLARLGLRLLVGPMRRWDYRAAQRPDYLIANSTHIQAMIRKYYGRESTVIFPPVDTERFSFKKDAVRKGYLTAGRQTPYKRIDLAVRACTKLGLPLTVIGSGPEHSKLQKMAGPTISFKTGVSDAAIVRYFQQAEVFIFPTNVEDFGITGVEAMAAGTPVIAYFEGGPQDYIVPTKTGDFFTEQSTASLEGALQRSMTMTFDHAAIAREAQRFSIKQFDEQLHRFISGLPDK